ncbi:uncharacterized protein RJT20DRAFT_49311 [Scheffersomyces xylosifermentans]|uniref:uncharacterized protein n=1 Tax=Scheffersomyces xylosifermentans TaxID=1304137 RepID=UPI00315DB7E8
MSRLAPLPQSCRNLVFNIRHYKPVRSRPPFQASNHAFCTNAQLLNASYTNWLKRTSKEIPSKIFNKLSELTERETAKHTSKAANKHFKDSTSPSSILVQQLPHSYKSPDLESDESLTESKRKLIPELTNLLKQNDLVKIQDLLDELDAKEVDADLINYILEETVKKAPSKPDLLFSECQIEVPRFEAENRLDFQSPYHSYIYEHIPVLYDIYQQHSHNCGANQKFQENYIWLCYHMNDLPEMENLVHTYFKYPEFDSRTLAYILTSFIRNFEVEFARGLFQNLLSLGKPVQNIVLETTILQMSQVGALFENFPLILQAWISVHPVVDYPSTKAISFLLDEYHRNGTPNEIQYLYYLISDLGYSEHYSIRLLNVQSDIIDREPYNYKKILEKSDLLEFDEINRSIMNEQELYDYYYRCLKFCSKYSNINMIQYFIMHLKDQNLHLLPQYFEVICDYYMKHSKFIQLFSFLQTSSSLFAFNEGYLQKVYSAFVQSYPYHAPEFASRFNTWVKDNEHFSPKTKTKLLNSLKITKLQSQLTPYHMERNIIASYPKKYEASQWSSIKWQQDKRGRAIKFSDQVSYRVNKGFVDVIRKGVKPDFSLVRETFRRSNPSNQLILIDLLKRTRLYEKNESQMDILTLESREQNKAYVEQFYIAKQHKFTTNDCIKFARMLINKNLFKEADDLMSTIDVEQVDDRTRMVLLNLQLRNYITYSQFEKMTETIDEFPIDDIVLSPYIYNQCCFIEKKLVGKIEHLEKRKKKIIDETEIDTSAKEDSADISSMELQQNRIEQANATLATLRGLIGDISVRLEKDNVDIRAIIQETFRFFDNWITSHDERKI